MVRSSRDLLSTASCVTAHEGLTKSKWMSCKKKPHPSSSAYPVQGRGGLEPMPSRGLPFLDYLESAVNLTPHMPLDQGWKTPGLEGRFYMCP